MLRNALRQFIDGPRSTRMRRFVTVGAIAAGLQMVLLWLFVDTGGLDYRVGAVIAIEITIVFQYVLNNAWTFHLVSNTGADAFLAGLVRTNLVRGSAIPIQIGVLYALVEWGELLYLLANAVAIGISGIYRYLLDTRWTWGADVF